MIDECTKQLTYGVQVRRPLASVPDALVIGGMGGSALAADALAFLLPERQILVHREYGVPAFPPEQALYIAISYSGNTEEVLSFANEALRSGKRLAVVSSGGTLEEFAERQQLPFANVPPGLAPRNAFIYMVQALGAVTGEGSVHESLGNVSVDAKALNEEAEQDAHYFLPSVPLFYTSSRNAVIGRMAKLIMNETARTPAFANVFPELNHNEMQAFDEGMPEGLEHLFRFVLIRDRGDDPRIVRRMEAFASLMEKRGRTTRFLDVGDMDRAEALVHCWIRFLIAGRYLAETRGIDPDTAPLVEAFKKQL